MAHKDPPLFRMNTWTPNSPRHCLLLLLVSLAWLKMFTLHASAATWVWQHPQHMLWTTFSLKQSLSSASMPSISRESSPLALQGCSQACPSLSYRAFLFQSCTSGVLEAKCSDSQHNSLHHSQILLMEQTQLESEQRRDPDQFSQGSISAVIIQLSIHSAQYPS